VEYLRTIINHLPISWAQHAASKANTDTAKHFDAMPQDMIVEIFGHLDARSLCRFSQSSHRFKKILDDNPVVWERLFYNAFPSLQATHFEAAKLKSIGYKNLMVGKGWDQFFASPEEHLSNKEKFYLFFRKYDRLIMGIIIAILFREKILLGATIGAFTIQCAHVLVERSYALVANLLAQQDLDEFKSKLDVYENWLNALNKQEALTDAEKLLLASLQSNIDAWYENINNHSRWKLDRHIIFNPQLVASRAKTVNIVLINICSTETVSKRLATIETRSMQRFARKIQFYKNFLQRPVWQVAPPTTPLSRDIAVIALGTLIAAGVIYFLYLVRFYTLHALNAYWAPKPLTLRGP
jgi:hypothetical protein